MLTAHSLASSDRDGVGVGFEIICEIEPPVSADLRGVRRQIAVLTHTCDTFLVPDNHLGRATVSSIAVAHEVGRLQGRAVACLNARDRNLLGFHRDLLTARAYGVDQLLLVYGDAPERGERSSLTVRQMLGEVAQRDRDSYHVGVAADVTRELPAWKRDADALFTQISFDVGAVARWRERVGFEGAVYSGVVVLANARMARRLADLIPGLEVPDAVLRDLSRGVQVGVDLAVEQMLELRGSGSVDGVHLVPAGRYLDTAEALRRAGL